MHTTGSLFIRVTAAMRTLVIICMGFILLSALETHALEECGEEPTDMPITFGMSFLCTIESNGDSDIFHFAASVGDRIIAEANALEGFRIFTCSTLFSPDGSIVDDSCEGDTPGSRVEASLVTDGVYTFVVRDVGDDGNGTYEVSLACTGGPCATQQGEPVLLATPEAADFGSTSIGDETTTVFTISNIGTGSLIVGDIGVTGDHAAEFIVNESCSRQSISAGLSCLVHITFTPTSEGTKTATLTVPTNDELTPSLPIALSGVGQGQARTPIGGNVNGTSPTRVVCVNLTTGQAVFIAQPARFWNCEQAGLSASRGDEISQTVVGIAE